MKLSSLMPDLTRANASALIGLALLTGLLPLPNVHAGNHSAIIPVQRSDEGSKRRFQELLDRVKAQASQTELVFLGDSITQGWEGAGKTVWSRYYNHRKALNLGIGGDRTQHVLWRLENGHAEGLNPKAVVLMIGTNNSNGEDNTPEQIADGVSAVITQLKTRMARAKIILVAIFPRGENFNPQRGKILQINQVIRRLADGDRVQWVDFGHEFVSSEGLIPATLMPDYLHLSSAGYNIWARSLEDTLSRILGDQRVPD